MTRRSIIKPRRPRWTHARSASSSQRPYERVLVCDEGMQPLIRPAIKDDDGGKTRESSQYRQRPLEQACPQISGYSSALQAVIDTTRKKTAIEQKSSKTWVKKTKRRRRG